MRALVPMLLLALSGCSSLPYRDSDGTRIPYPKSRYVTGVSWDFSTLGSYRKAHGSDLWPCTWATDSNVYCAWGDGGGFDGDSDNIGRVSLGFARLEGVPTTGDPSGFTGKNVWGAAPGYAEHQATFGGKVGTMICVAGVLYAYGHLWTHDVSSDPIHQSGVGPVHRLIWSQDLGASWHIAPWENPFVGSFLNFGPDNAGAPDEFVYIYYQRKNDSTHVFLTRVPHTRLGADPRISGAYEFLAGVDRRGNPRSWSSSEGAARPVFTDPAGADVLVVYDAPIRRFLLTSSHNPQGTVATAAAGKVGLFEAPHPWGPWATVGYYDTWGNLGPDSVGDYLGLVFPTKWISADGRTLWAVFSSLGQYDSFNLVKATLSVSAAVSH